MNWNVVGVLTARAGRAVSVGVLGAVIAAGALGAPMPGVLPVRADLATATLSPTSIYLRTCEIDTTRTPVETRAAAAHPRLDAGKWYLLQLDGPITPARRQALREAGVRLAEYMQVNTFLATADNAAIPAAGPAPVNFVRFVAPYQPEWKLDPEIGVRPYVTPERQVLAAQGRVSVTITLHQGEALQPVLNRIAELGDAELHYTEEVGGNTTISVTCGKDGAAKLARLDAVQFIEDGAENTQRSNYADRWILQSNVTGVFPLYANGITGTGQILGHCDGSVNTTHCSFRDTVNPVGPSHRKIIDLNGTSGYDQHGTHTAATAIGFDPASADTANVNGVATGAKLTHTSIPSQTEAGVTAMLNTQYADGARVHTNSWGDDGTTAYTGQCRGIDAHVYTNEDSLVCFAVSNLSTVRTPENAKNCFGVNRSTYTPTAENICGTTATGPTNDGRRKPEIMAPGCSIISASGSGTVCTTASLTGTSMACPAVAGVSLLVRQYYADGYYPTGAPVPANGFNPSAALVKATLFNSAVDMSGVTGFPSNQEGWGRILSDNALYFAGDARKAIAYDVRNAQGLSTGGIVDYPVTVTAGQSFKAALVWTEPAAAANANPAYINNLDLEVIDPASTLYRGNNFSGGVSVSGGTADIRNNAEIVFLTAPSAGQWTVRVRATAVNQGTQGYALVITGGVSSAPPPPPAPGPFNLVSPSDGATNQSLTPTLSWSASSDADTYTVTISANAFLFPPLHVAGGLVGTSYNVPGAVLTAGNTYYWGVTAVNPQGNTGSTPSSRSFATTPPPPPCVGDLNNDTLRDTADLTIMLGNFGGNVTPNTGGDLDGNGHVDTNDLAAFLGVFGIPCP